GSLVLMSGEDKRILQTAEQMARAHGLKVLGALHKPVFPEMLHRMLDLALLSAAPEATPAGSAAYAPAELREALSAGQLLNHYQPKLRLDTGEPVGLEAQVRWQHPRDGLLMPQAFMATADVSGLLRPICQAMLATALVDAAQWRDEGYGLHVAASVSLS